VEPTEMIDDEINPIKTLSQKVKKKINIAKFIQIQMKFYQ
jgi:hypothetical protein